MASKPKNIVMVFAIPRLANASASCSACPMAAQCHSMEKLRSALNCIQYMVLIVSLVPFGAHGSITQTYAETQCKFPLQLK